MSESLVLDGEVPRPTVERHETMTEALLAFHTQVPVLPKDKTAEVKSQKGSYSYSYTDLGTIMEKIGPLLIEHGLVWSAQPTITDTGQPTLSYKLVHTSGGKIEGTMPLLLAKQDSQSLGSALTYARRYALCAVLNLIADEDDDGRTATEPAPAAPEREAAPRIPQDRAAAILRQAIDVGHATLDMEADRGTPPELSAVLKAKLSLIGVNKIGALNVDQAEELEAFLAGEASA